MATGPEFRIGMDGAQAMSVLAQLQNKMKDVGNTAKSELAQKLTSVFSVVAVEEMVRRTGLWAQQIQQTSKELGISGEALQTLQNIASKTGLPEDAVTSMFNNLADARDKALAGNKELIYSFQRVGVSLSDLQTDTKQQLFGHFLSGLSQAAPNGIIHSKDNYLRQSVKDLTNTPENYVQAIQGQVPGGDFAEAIETGKKEGGVLPEGDVSSLGTTLSQIGQDFKEIGNELKPVAGFILNIVHTFTTAVLGVVQAFGDIKNMLVGWVTGDLDKVKTSLADLGALFANMGAGILKPFVSALDFLANAIVGAANSMIKIHNMIPGLTKLPTVNWHSDAANGFGTIMADANKTLGISETTANRGEAMGLAATMVGPEALVGGTSAVAKSVLSTTKNVMKDGLKATGKSMAQDTVQAVKDIIKKPEVAESGKQLSTEKTVWDDEFKKALQSLGVKEKSYFFTQSGRVWEKKFGKVAGPSSAGNAGLYTGLIAGAAAGQNKNLGTTPIDRPPIVPNIMAYQGIGAGSGGAMLKMGGTFGSGFESRLIVLTEEMAKNIAKMTGYLQYMSGPMQSDINNQPSGLP